MPFITSNSPDELIGLGTRFEMDTLSYLRQIKNPKTALAYLVRRYDILVGAKKAFAPQLLTRHANTRGYWYFDLREKERRFAPEDQIDLEKYWRRIRDYYMGAFFGEERGSLITVTYERLYKQEGELRPAIWRYVTGRKLKINDLERLGIPKD